MSDQGATLLIDDLQERMSSISNELQSKAMAAYMKDKFPYFGIKSPERKKISSELWKNGKQSISENWKEIVVQLWEKDEREYQYVAMDWMARIEGRLSANDLPVVEKLIVKKSWWDTVDFLAGHPLGKILSLDEKLKFQTAERYIQSDNMWLRRSALLFQLFYKEKTDAGLLFDLIKRCKGSKEFFINKACGWALRQYSKTKPIEVSRFIEENREELSALTIKEGSKYLN